MKINKKIIAYISSIFFLLVIWWIASLVTGSALILPSPLSVVKTGLHLAVTLAFWKAFAFTFLRILTSFAISIVLGFTAGFLFSRSSFLKHFFEPYFYILQVTPVVALILVVMFWFKSNTVPVFVALLMTLPFMTNSVYHGFVSVDPKLKELAKVYNFSRIKAFFNISLPSAYQSIKLGIKTIFGLTWKVVVAGEVLSLPKYSIGTMLQNGNIHLETERVMAVTLLLVVLCFVLQKIVEFLLSCKEHKNNL